MAGKRQLGLAMVGIGVGGTEMLPAMEAMPELRLVAGCDVNEDTLNRFAERYNAKGYGDYDEMLADPEVEAVWVSTPNRFHAEHSIRAMEAGKHVVVEKPMALNLEDAQKMVETANRTGVKFLAGHTRSFTPPVRTMWKIIQSGEIGHARAINAFAYTDWMLRPRTWEELDMAQGGGLPMRQLPHQIDSVRLLGGGMVKSVRGTTGQWMPERPIPGYYAAFLEFEDGTTSLVCHDGYGYVMGAEFVTWGHDRQRYTSEERVEVRRQMREGTRDESEDKQALRIGGLQEREVFKAENDDLWVPEDLGLLIATCERGDIRHGPRGLILYDDRGTHAIDLAVDATWAPATAAQSWRSCTTPWWRTGPSSTPASGGSQRWRWCSASSSPAWRAERYRWSTRYLCMNATARRATSRQCPCKPAGTPGENGGDTEHDERRDEAPEVGSDRHRRGSG